MIRILFHALLMSLFMAGIPQARAQTADESGLSRANRHLSSACENSDSSFSVANHYDARMRLTRATVGAPDSWDAPSGESSALAVDFRRQRRLRDSEAGLLARGT